MRLLRREGLSSDKVRTIAGAAGGPKWLVLSQIDRVLFGEWIKPRPDPLFLVGSSIGTWRFSAIARSQPVKGIEAFEAAYLAQSYSGKPDAEEVTKESKKVMDGFLTDADIAELLNHPYYRLHAIAIRCKNVFNYDHKAALLSGLALAATANALHPKLLNKFFERVVFSDPRHSAPFLNAPGFRAQRIVLEKTNLRHAVLASGSIPGVMEGVSDIPGHEGHVFRDGGMQDYHLDLPYHGGDPKEEFTLFPHFSETIIPNWFDKGLPWRKPSQKNLSHVILIAPSKDFISRLPYGKIPDRNDFKLFKGRDLERVAYWRQVLQECQKLGDELRELLDSGKIVEVAQPLAM